MQPISASVVAGLSAASTIAAVHAARAQASTSCSPARSSDIPRGTPSPIPAQLSQPPPPPSTAASGSGLLAGGGPDGGAINYVSSSDSSSPLSETYRPANECSGGATAATAAAAAASSKRQSVSDPKTCFKQVQFHLNNIAHAAPLLKHKLSGSGRLSLTPGINPSGNASGSAAAAAATTTATAATTTTQARLLAQIPILRSVRKTRKKRKKIKPSEAAKQQLTAAEANEHQHQQVLAANLPPSKAFLYSCLSKAAKVPPDGKDIVYNGTFPIDQPLCSRFKNLSFSLSSTDTELDGMAGLPPRREFGDSCTGEQTLRKRNSATGAVGGAGAGAGKVVKTFAIDEPI